MPLELYSLEDLQRVAPKAVECRVKRSTRDGKAKIKVRTKRYLYTYKVDPSQVDSVISKLGCKNVVDIDKEVAEEKARRAEERKKAKEAKKAAAQAAQQAQEQPSAPAQAPQAQPAQAAAQVQQQQTQQEQPTAQQSQNQSTQSQS